MCMEDKRIGRRTLGTEKAVVVGVANTPIVGGSPSRVMLCFNPPIAGQVTFSTVNNVTFGGGINLAAGCDPIVLTIEEFGDLVRKPWFAFADAANRTVGVFEGILSES